MNINKLEQYLSPTRFNRFLQATNHSALKAEELYGANLNVAKSFYPVLNLFEIVLRNSIDISISTHFGDSDWIINQKNGFMSDKSLMASNFYLKKSIEKAQKTITNKKVTVTSGKIIAEQSFGFWTSLFETHHFKLIGGCVIQIFNNKPKHINRNIITKKLTKIREFRNRIYHNEPICFNGTNIDFTEANQVKNEIYNLLKWIDTDLATYVQNFDSIDDEILLAMNI
ncbi:hypothetical protein VB264_14385 [Arcicella aquatica]|uniref:Abi-like protein n=1 Tax=Arcicella aquatica TaxID=217141 RepID=A0ABU5QQ30_9BACT|nr:hypothetical protein [Arcicella aquatica]MEA5258980.1 hypothetical protein [Arcicella aquatica]